VNPKNFFAELKRRNVYKVAVAYAIVGWLVMQIAATVVPAAASLRCDYDRGRVAGYPSFPDRADPRVGI